MVDTLDLKSNGHYGRAGSSPAPGTVLDCQSPYNQKIMGAFLLTNTERTTEQAPQVSARRLHQSLSSAACREKLLNSHKLYQFLFPN
jgi:hypothetical protein